MRHISNYRDRYDGRTSWIMQRVTLGGEIVQHQFMYIDEVVEDAICGRAMVAEGLRMARASLREKLTARIARDLLRN